MQEPCGSIMARARTAIGRHHGLSFPANCFDMTFPRSRHLRGRWTLKPAERRIHTTRPIQPLSLPLPSSGYANLSCRPPRLCPGRQLPGLPTHPGDPERSSDLSEAGIQVRCPSASFVATKLPCVISLRVPNRSPARRSQCVTGLEEMPYRGKRWRIGYCADACDAQRAISALSRNDKQSVNDRCFACLGDLPGSAALIA